MWISGEGRCSRMHIFKQRSKGACGQNAKPHLLKLNLPRIIRLGPVNPECRLFNRECDVILSYFLPLPLSFSLHLWFLWSKASHRFLSELYNPSCISCLPLWQVLATWPSSWWDWPAAGWCSRWRGVTTSPPFAMPPKHVFLLCLETR